MTNSDDIAHTATAVGEPRSDAKPLDEKALGRYRLEKKLGEGGMGVVHAAFDPDLERRVALKVLRGSGSNEAQQRLLREARAMARLTHPNVVVVHEVGNANGRDYVAMELIDGENLSDWLRAAKRDRAEILSAFIAAGRGLAAAHAANLVHRDFKPHNILRGNDGRVVVTDFGLARGVDALPTGKPDALEQTIDPSSTPSSLSGLTMTGSVLGTPAYMAPEQWNAQAIGPAADQFAFCVALWEALVGERPYRGETFEQLKAAVERGPAALDTSKLPADLRAVVQRGLDPDPAKRWPSMDVLLAKLSPKPTASKKLRIGVAVGGAVLVAAGVLLATKAAPSSACAPPARDIEAVWSASTHGGVKKELVPIFDHHAAAWRTERAFACTAHDTPRLTCLDGVLARTDTILRALAKVKGPLSKQVPNMLVAPSVCATSPRLTITPTEDIVAATALYAGAHPGTTVADEAAGNAFAAKPGLDPCARAIALLAVDQITSDVSRGKAATTEAIVAADACGDDRLRADAILAEFLYEAEKPTVGPRGIAALQKASVAVKRVAQPELTSRIDGARASYAAQQGRWDEAFSAAKTSLDELSSIDRPRLQIHAVELLNGLRFQRNLAGDMAAVRADVAKWRPIAIEHHDDDLVDGLDQSDAYARLFLGDLPGAHAEIVRLWQKSYVPDPTAAVLHGTVVDERGAPVANATVATATSLFIDSIGPLPFSSGQVDFQTATTDAHGNYELVGVAQNAVIAAQSDPRHRSTSTRAAPNMRLVLHPTRNIRGKVALGDTPSTRTFVMASSATGRDLGRFLLMSPIATDGTYSIEGVTTSELKIGVTTWGVALSSNVELQVVPAGTTDISLPLAATKSARTLDVIVRSQTASPFEAAQVFVFDGKHTFAKVGEMGGNNNHLLGMQQRFAQHIVGEAVPAAARGQTQATDLVAHFTDVSSGEVSACAIGLNVDVSDPVALHAINAHRDDLVMACATADANATAIVVEAPSQKRYD